MILLHSRNMVSQLLLQNNMLSTYQGVVTSTKHSEKPWSSYVCFGLLPINKTGCRVLVWERCSQFSGKKENVRTCLFIKRDLRSAGLIDFNHWFLSFPDLIVSDPAQRWFSAASSVYRSHTADPSPFYHNFFLAVRLLPKLRTGLNWLLKLLGMLAKMMRKQTKTS